MSDTQNKVLKDIRSFCKKEGISESSFGRFVAKDHKLVPQIEAGRKLGKSLKHRIYDYIEKRKPLRDRRDLVVQYIRHSLERIPYYVDEHGKDRFIQSRVTDIADRIVGY